MAKGRLTIDFTTRNVTFDSNESELRSVLTRAANMAVDLVSEGATAVRVLRDSNENVVGNVTYHHEGD